MNHASLHPLTNSSPIITPAGKGVLQRKCACGNQAAGGECTECAKKKLQRQLRVGASNDPLETEADRVADQVLANNSGTAETSPAISSVQRHSSTTSEATDDAPTSVNQTLSGSGKPLDKTTRTDMESRFGHDFSQVRIHQGSTAEKSARDVNANAYTLGNNIVFGAGQFNPASQTGKRLLAHELTHVVQQVGISKNQIRRAPAPPKSIPPADVAAIKSRLEAIIRSGGDVPKETRVIGAAIVQVEGGGYKGSPERRAISSKITDDVGKGAAVPHDVSPDNRSFSATRSIAGSGARKEFPFSHVNDAEMKLFEGITKDLAPGAKGTIHFMTMRVRQVNGQTVFEPYPACSGCTRASFELAGAHPNMSIASHAPVHTAATLNLGENPTATKPVMPEGKSASSNVPAKAAPQNLPSTAPKQQAAAQTPTALKPAAPSSTPTAKAPANPALAPSSVTKASDTKPSTPLALANTKPSGGSERQRFSAPVGAFSRPGNFADEANAKAQAKGNAAILAVQGVLAILSYFADKYQRERADAAWAEVYPRIQEEVTRTGRGVVVYVEYTQNTGSSVLVFEGIHWSSGGNDSGQPGALRAPGQTASFSRSYVGPTEAQASITDETALMFRRDEARTRQRDLQGIAERMAKEGWLGRKLRERAGGNIDPLRAYDAKAHIVSASQSIKDKRYSDAANSLDKADAALDEMWAQIKTYVGEKKLKELSGED